MGKNTDATSGKNSVRGLLMGIRYGLGQTTRGVPLGGLGTGSLELGIDGSLSHSQLQNNWTGSALKQLEQLSPASFFAVAVSRPDGANQLRLLQGASPLVLPTVKDLTYDGHFPFADLDYDVADLGMELRLEAFCPFIPYDARNSAIPGIVFSFRIANTSPETKEAALAFSWANDLGATMPRGPYGNRNALREDPGLRGLHMTTTRRDFRGQDEYAIALVGNNAAFSCLPEWSLKSGGRGFAEAFSPQSLRPGAPPQALPPASHRPGSVPGAIAASVKLKPGERQTVSFLLTWYAPNHRDADGNHLGHMYSNWFANAWEVADYLADHLDDLCARSRQWQLLIERSSLPPWLQNALVNYLCFLARGTWWTKDGRFTVYEGLNCPLIEPSVLRTYGAFPFLFMFPELSRNSLDQEGRFQHESGEIPSFLGTNALEAPQYGCFPAQSNCAFVLMIFYHYRYDGGTSYAVRMFPAVKKAIRYLHGLDTDGDFLLNNHGIDQGWDTWPIRGTVGYVNAYWLTTLSAAEELARVSGDETFARECREWREKAAANFEAQLWTGEYYALFRDIATGEHSATCFLGQFYGHLFAHLLDLPTTLPADHVRSGLTAIDRLNVADSPLGATTGVKPNGQRDTSSTGNAQSRALAPCEIFPYTAACCFEGLPQMGLKASEKFCRFLEEKLRAPWQSLLLMYPDSGELFYGTDYFDNLNIWTIPVALLGFRYDVETAAMTLSPALIPCKIPVFSPRFYGMVEYEANEREGKPQVRLVLTNAREESVKLRTLRVRFLAQTIRATTTLGVVRAEARDGFAVLTGDMALSPGRNELILEEV